MLSLRELFARTLPAAALLSRALPDSWIWPFQQRLVRGLVAVRCTLSRKAMPKRVLEPGILSMTLEAFTRFARPFNLPYRVVGSELLLAAHAKHGGSILCGSHAFPLNRLVHNPVRDLGLKTVRVVAPVNIDAVGTLWGRDEPLETVEGTPFVLLRVARHLSKGAVVIFLPDYVGDDPDAVSPQIFELARSLAFPMLFFATRLADDGVPEVVIEASPSLIIRSTTERDLCIAAYRAFKERHARVLSH